ncbi:MAG: ABC transporter ATP-binding protein [Cytophagales bacterium]|nr:ABC transporter ATP-binding protein [Cytophagales bacterium]
MLSIKNVTKYYGEHRALGDVSFDVPTGCVYGLLGHNGAGKTTLIRMITQITAPDSGQIFIDGERLVRKHIPMIGYLPEERGLYKKMTVKEHLIYLAVLRGISKKEALEKISYWLEKMSIADRENTPIEGLSKGMQQKIQFIATVLHDPKLLILDEPFSGFDPVNVAIVKQEILALKKKGTTIIFSTHRMESVEELCDEITIINRSQNVLSGRIDKIKEDHRQAIYTVKIKADKVNIPFVKVLKERKRNGVLRLDLMVEEGTEITSNALLMELMKYGEIVSFKEKLPSINDIFLKHVKPELNAQD